MSAPTPERSGPAPKSGLTSMTGTRGRRVPTEPTSLIWATALRCRNDAYATDLRSELGRLGRDDDHQGDVDHHIKEQHRRQ